MVGRRTGLPPWSPASYPVWALVSGYPSRIRGEKPLAFLQAFVDDSASDVGDRRLFMAGYLNRAEKWALHEDAWDEALHAPPSIDYLKMSEARGLRGQFQGWLPEDRDEKLRGLARVIRHFKPQSFQFSLSREVFQRVLTPVNPRGLNPHFTCCFGVVSIVAKYVASQKVDLPIDFIFDTQQGVSGDIVLYFEQLHRALPKKIRKLIPRVPIFRDDKHFVQLQAADMLAWHVRRAHEVAPEQLPMRMLLLSDPHVAAEYSDAMIQHAADHHRQLPGISSIQSKAQWQNFRKEIQNLRVAGIDPSKIKGPGIYYPDNAPWLVRAIGVVKRRFRQLFPS